MKRGIASSAIMYLLALVMAVTTQPASTAETFDGQQIFRFDTFGDEQLWTDTLQLHQAVASLSPVTALSVGLKVDVEALPQAVIGALRAGQVDLNDPRVTVQLLALHAVVGAVGNVTATGHLESIGITCALCHSTVDDSFAAGIGRRLDGWPNRDLNVGAIIALSPVLSEEQKAVFNSWGPGKYDPRLQAFNGANLIPLNSPTLPVVIPPAYGLRLVGFETFTGDGPISYWNNYVAVTQMGGQGSFSDPRIGLSITQNPDLVTPKLPALLDYQLTLRAPAPPRGSFNRVAAQRGRQLFNGVARCGECHTPPAFTDVLRGRDRTVPFLHAPSEVGAEPAYALRSATGLYRTTPLRGVWQHPPYFHDGSAPDLLAVVNHYDAVLSLGLTAAQKADLVEFLNSL
jgi:hypothetical protein